MSGGSWSRSASIVGASAFSPARSLLSVHRIAASGSQVARPDRPKPSRWRRWAACGQAPDRELERLLARSGRGAGGKPILELNMRHPQVKALGQAQTQGRTDDVADLSALLFDQAQILDGEVPNEPAAFAARFNRLVVRGLPAAG